MKILLIARKTLLEGWREPQLYGLLMFFPAMMMVIYFFAFGQTDQGLSQLIAVLVLDQDRSPASAGLVEAIQTAEFDGSRIFSVTHVADRQAAELPLKERKAALLLVIPSGFSQAVEQAALAPAAGLAELQMVGDATLDNYMFAYGFLVSIADEWVKETTGQQPPANFDWAFVPGTGTLSDLQFGVPGLLVFGVMFGALYSATLLVREEVSGTLLRLRLTRARAAQLLAGIGLAGMVSAAAQVPVAFGTGLALGFKNAGSLPLAIAIGVVLSLSATGLGLIAACFSHSDGEAANISTVLMMPVVFLSGAVFPMPELPLGKLAGHTFSLYDLLPTTHAGEAMRRVLIFGDGPAEIGYELAGLVLLSLAYLALGVILYQRLRLDKLNK